MSFVLAAPQALATAASKLSEVGSTLSGATATAAARTNSVAVAAADEVSTQIAALFSEHGQAYQQLSAQALAFHERFVAALTESAHTYAAAEANTAQSLSNSLAGAGTTLSGAASNVAHHIGSVLPGNGGLTSLLGSGPAAAKALTGGPNALTTASAALSPAAATHSGAYYPYYGYYGYPLIDFFYGLIGTILYDPFYLPYYLVNSFLDFVYYLLYWI